jgi:hypothetical protein
MTTAATPTNLPPRFASLGEHVTLYVANCTPQNAILYYRTRFNDDGTAKDENRRFEAARQQPIPTGRQTVFGARQMHMQQAMEIIGQLSKHGMMDAEDVKRSRNQKIPFVFNLNKPVPAEVMKAAIATNSSILTAEGQLRRKRAAVAVNDLVVQAAAAEAAKRGQDPEKVAAPNTEVVFEQLEQSEAGERTIGEGYRVNPGAGTPAPARGGNRRRRAG